MIISLIVSGTASGLITYLVARLLRLHVKALTMTCVIGVVGIWAGGGAGLVFASILHILHETNHWFVVHHWWRATQVLAISGQMIVNLIAAKILFNTVEDRFAIHIWVVCLFLSLFETIMLDDTLLRSEPMRWLFVGIGFSLPLSIFLYFGRWLPRSINDPSHVLKWLFVVGVACTLELTFIFFIAPSAFPFTFA